MEEQLILEPIGTIKTSLEDKYIAPRQPGLGEERHAGIIELLPGKNFEQAVEGLQEFEKIWLLYWFDRNDGWKPMVQVPRGPSVKRGLFSTRSPHRPNPIGLSLVTLEKVSGRKIWVRDVDLLNNTPILDIKPYLPAVEAWPNAAAGWTTEIQPQNRQLIWSARAQTQWEIVTTYYGEEWRESVLQLLRSLTFTKNHPYKRVKQIGSDLYEVAYKTWRFIVEPQEDTSTITEIRSGYGNDIETIDAKRSEISADEYDLHAKIAMT